MHCPVNYNLAPNYNPNLNPNPSYFHAVRKWTSLTSLFHKLDVDVDVEDRRAQAYMPASYIVN